jgi:hypothetical protein
MSASKTPRAPSVSWGVLSILYFVSPCECGGRTAVFEAARRGSNPRRGTRTTSAQRPRSVVDRTRLCEGRGPGPNPGEDIFEIFETHLTPEPDGRAAACKAACSGFDSHRRFFSGLLRWCRPVQRRKGLPRLARGLVDQVRVFRTWVLKRPSPTSVSSVDRAPDLRSGCRGFDSRTKHQALGC